MNEVQLFNFENHKVRSILLSDEPWFVGRDVAEVLGYAKPSNAITQHVDEEDRKGTPIQGTPGGTQNMTIINESGLYSLVLSSKLPSAKKFKRQGTDYNMPTQKAMELGLFEIKEGSYVNGSGVNITTKTPKITGKGQQYFINKFLAKE